MTTLCLLAATLISEIVALYEFIVLDSYLGLVPCTLKHICSWERGC